ncbi:hypothetical protein HDU96_001642 [Phlyctochytrium bullatum]|nr:hypothetical protein HDU96_001642 [Phlyctochytrium bullatum]
MLTDWLWPFPPSPSFKVERDVPDLSGRTILITGATSGLGKATAEALAAKGHAIAEALATKYDRCRVDVVHADLSSLSSVHEFAQAYIDTGLPLHVILNNAGTLGARKCQLTEDGIELHQAINYFAAVLLTLELLPVLVRTAEEVKQEGKGGDVRVVNVASFMHSWVHNPVNLEGISNPKGYDLITAYCNSKLMLIQFTRYLHYLLSSSKALLKRPIAPIHLIALDPGFVSTTIFFQHLSLISIGAGAVSTLFGNSPRPTGCLTHVFACAGDLETAAKSPWRQGGVGGETKQSEAAEGPRAIGRHLYLVPHARKSWPTGLAWDLEEGRRVWKFTLNLLKEKGYGEVVHSALEECDWIWPFPPRPTFSVARDVPSLTKHTIVITGPTAGLGKATAEALASKGAHLIFACRNEQKGLDLAKTLESKYDKCKVDVIQADMASLTSVHAFADKLLEREIPIHVLYNNAGVFGVHHGLTEDGLETHLGVNYMATALLTLELLPTMLETARKLKADEKEGVSHEGPRDVRVVNITSFFPATMYNPVNLDTINEKKGYDSLTAYAQSKLLIIQFTRHLHFLLSSAEAVRPKNLAPVHLLAVDPGFLATSLFFRHLSFVNIGAGLLSLMFAASPYRIGYLTPVFGCVGDLEQAVESSTKRAGEISEQGEEASESAQAGIPSNSTAPTTVPRPEDACNVPAIGRHLYLIPYARIGYPTGLSWDLEEGKKLWHWTLAVLREKGFGKVIDKAVKAIGLEQGKLKKNGGSIESAKKEE